MPYFLFIFIVIIVTHAIYNLINFLRYSYIEKLFFGLFSDDVKVKDKSLSSKNTLLNYMKYADVSDKYIPCTQSLGYGQIVNSNVSIFENITNNRQDIASTAYKLLLEAKGNYWSRFINSINPFYWIRIVLFIPKHLLTYLGVKSDHLIIKIFQLSYWLIGTIFTLLISIYPSEIKNFVDSIIHFS